MTHLHRGYKLSIVKECLTIEKILRNFVETTKDDQTNRSYYLRNPTSTTKLTIEVQSVNNEKVSSYLTWYQKEDGESARVTQESEASA